MPLVINVDSYVTIDEINAKCLALGFLDFLTADESTVEGYARQACL